MSSTEPLALGSKLASTVPSVLSRAIWLRLIAVPVLFGRTVVNEPPIRSFPSDGWRVRTNGVPFSTGL